MIRGRTFNEMIRFRLKSQLGKSKVGATIQKSELHSGRPLESEPDRPEKEPEWV